MKKKKKTTPFATIRHLNVSAVQNKDLWQTLIKYYDLKECIFFLVG